MSSKLEYIVQTLRQHQDKLADMDVSYTALFRPREPIDVSDNVLWTSAVSETVAGVTAGKPWRKKDRVREIFGADSPATPPKAP
jgi:hypothetical protein